MDLRKMDLQTTGDLIDFINDVPTIERRLSKQDNPLERLPKEDNPPVYSVKYLRLTFPSSNQQLSQQQQQHPIRYQM